jgi:hypothetical protein
MPQSSKRRKSGEEDSNEPEAVDEAWEAMKRAALAHAPPERRASRANSRYLSGEVTRISQVDAMLEEESKGEGGTNGYRAHPGLQDDKAVLTLFSMQDYAHEFIDSVVQLKYRLASAPSGQSRRGRATKRARPQGNNVFDHGITLENVPEITYRQYKTVARAAAVAPSSVA